MNKTQPTYTKEFKQQEGLSIALQIGHLLFGLELSMVLLLSR